MNRIYFDHAATTPVDKRVLEAMLPYFSDAFGNPSSVLIEEGGRPREALDEARRKVADLVGAEADEIIFTASATESNNLAIKGLAMAHKHKGIRVLLSEIEHYSVMLQADFLRAAGFDVDFVKVDPDGLIDMADLEKKATKGTVLASIMHANMEIGTVQPIAEIARLLKSRGVLLHTDGAGTAGQIPVNVKELGVDAMTISGHQFHGPKGAAGLYLGRGVPLRPVLHGGFQEMGYRAGTENVPAIVGFGEACRLAGEEMTDKVARLSALGQRLRQGIGTITYLHFTGHPTERLPGHVSFWIEFVEGESLLLWLNLNGVAASTGSACASNVLAADETGLKASHVLTAVGVPPEICHGSITFSLGRDSTAEEVKYVVSLLPTIVDRLREMSPLYEQARKGGL
jgi:cysteine desulfurase